MKFLITSGVEKQLLEAAAAQRQRNAAGSCWAAPATSKPPSRRRTSPHDRTRSFEIDPAVLLRTHREARGAGQQVIGHYHSHPNGRAEPSKRDAARAVENGQLWLIIAGDKITAWTTQLPPPCGEGDSTLALSGVGVAHAATSEPPPRSLRESPSPPSPEATSGRGGGSHILHNRFHPVTLEPA